MLNPIFINYTILVVIVKCSEAARILCYQPIPFDSHQKVLHILTEELARQGHQLVVLTALPRKEQIENITEIDVQQISYSISGKAFEDAIKQRKRFAFPDSIEFSRIIVNITSQFLTDFKKRRRFSIRRAYLKSVRLFLKEFFDLQFNHPTMQALINNKTEKFDLIIVECSIKKIGNLLSATFGAPLLIASAMTDSAEVFSLVGAETSYFYYPDSLPISTHLSNLTFWQKVCSFFNILRMKFLNPNIVNNIFKEKKNEVEMLFLNVQHFWDNNRPVPIASVLYMGGLHLKSPTNLPQDLRTFLDGSKHGVVIVSFGSKLKMSTLPERTLRIMVDVFSQLPYDFIWHWDADGMSNKPKNVRLEKFLPLSDLMYNPNVRALVSHGGLLSTYEAIAARVPLIIFPIFGDQWLNAQKCESYGIGIRLDIDFLNEEDFKDAVVAVIEDKKYRDNIDRLSRIFSDRRESPLQGAARRVRQLTRGPRLLRARSPLADTTFVDFYMLDLLATAIICVLFVSGAIVFAVKQLITLLARVPFM